MELDFDKILRIRPLSISNKKVVKVGNSIVFSQLRNDISTQIQLQL